MCHLTWRRDATNNHTATVKFPPPLRFFIPISLLVAGLIASWMDYELNLANDLERHLDEAVKQAGTTGTRLAAQVARHLNGGGKELLEDVAAWKDEPGLKFAALVDGQGIVRGSVLNKWDGLPASGTPLATAWTTAGSSASPTLEPTRGADGNMILSAAFPVRGSTSQLLAVFDLTQSAHLAHEDAQRQLVWSAQLRVFFSLCVWAALHFGVAVRLGRLARQVRDFGEGRVTGIATLGGADELHDLALDFAAMGQRLAERERERDALEREVIETVENERRRIGHELHDGIGQHLTAALMAMNGMSNELKRVDPVYADKMLQLSGDMRDTITEVRSLSHGLSPVPLWEHGLEDALRSLAEITTRNAGVCCVFECPERVPAIYEATAGHLYRIAQEAVNNALKHAEAGEIRIGLEKREKNLVMEVDDDGCGLPDTMPKDGGIGLRVMQHRARMIGGKIELGPAPAGGTRIAIAVPIFP